MKITIISGSNSPQSGSRKVSDYVTDVVRELQEESTLLDMHEVELPMWSAEMWNNESEQAANWEQYRCKLQQTDALVVVAAEWNGTIPPSLHNFIMHMGLEVAHKPVLIVSVSAGIGGSYPISEIKAFVSKNNRMLFVPDHVIVRNVGDDFETSEHPIGPRIRASVSELVLYAKHMKALRKDLEFDYKQFKNGM